MNGSKVFTNLIWRFAERIGARLISVVVNLILARVLGAEKFGTVAIVLIITDILQVFIESGFGTALIQKKNADDLDFSSVFFFNITACVILYTLLFALAPWISRLYHRPELLEVIRVVGLILIISGVRNVQQAYVSRNMLFKRFFFATIGGTICAAVVGIWMAYRGYGVWAYVAQYLVNNLVGTLILWFTVKWRPKAIFSFERLKGLFSFGWKLLASSLLNTVSEKLRPMIIGYRYTSADLALYNEGMIFPNLIVENVNSSIDSVLLPALSEQQDSKERVRQMTKHAISLSSYIMWPLMFGLFACARPMVSLILGEEWIKAMGRSDIFLNLEIIKKILGLTVLIITVFISMKVMALSMIFTSVLSQLINSWPNRKLCGYTFIEQLRDILPSFILAAGMCAAVFALSLLHFGDLATLVMQVPFGAALYLAGSFLFKLEPFQYLLEVVKKFRHE